MRDFVDAKLSKFHRSAEPSGPRFRVVQNDEDPPTRAGGWINNARLVDNPWMLASTIPALGLGSLGAAYGWNVPAVVAADLAAIGTNQALSTATKMLEARTPGSPTEIALGVIHA